MSGPVDSSDLTSIALREPKGDGPLASPVQCLLCGGARHRSVFTELDIDILRCDSCGHVFSSFRGDPHSSGFWGSEVAPGEHLYWSKARARMYRAFFGRFIAGRAGRLLDMGSGLGFFLKAMAAYPAWDAYGCEISPAAVKYARDELGLKNVICSRLQDVDLPPASFDVITMWDVIDHVPHPDPLLERCHALLKREGTLFIRTPNVTVQLLRARIMRAIGAMRIGTKYLQGTDHAHHYSMDSIRRLLERNGFAEVRFVHLPPVETGTGWRGVFVSLAKTGAFQALRTLAICSAGRLNFDNLFVVARKGVRSPSS